MATIKNGAVLVMNQKWRTLDVEKETEFMNADRIIEAVSMLATGDIEREILCRLSKGR